MKPTGGGFAYPPCTHVTSSRTGGIARIRFDGRLPLWLFCPALPGSALEPKLKSTRARCHAHGHLLSHSPSTWQWAWDSSVAWRICYLLSRSTVGVLQLVWLGIGLAQPVSNNLRLRPVSIICINKRSRSTNKLHNTIHRFT